MRARALLVALMLALPFTPLGRGAATPTLNPRISVAAAMQYLATVPRSPDSFGNDAAGAYVIEAAAQAGLDPKAWPSSSDPAWNHAWPENASTDAGLKYDMQLAVASATSGYDPHSFHGVDLIAAIRASFVGTTFGSNSTINGDAWAILALVAAGIPPADSEIQSAARVLRASELADGGWNYAIAPKSDPDMTGMVLAALNASGENVSSYTRAAAYLDSTLDPTTHLHADSGGPNCQSTVWALDGYRLMGLPWRASTLAALAGLQRSDGGLAYAPGYTSEDAWCTTEAVSFSATGGAPFPGFAAGQVQAEAVAGSPTKLADGPFDTFNWTFPSLPAPTVEGRVVTLPSRGAVNYTLYANSSTARWRTRGVVNVSPPLPTAALATAEVHALRDVATTLDASPSTAPQAMIVAYAVDWGDGDSTTSAQPLLEHAYERPGNWSAHLRVENDAGMWSAPAAATVQVADRPPLLGGVPSVIYADRIHTYNISPSINDPEGDPVRLCWTLGNLSGTGPAIFHLTALGNETLRFTATDPYGGEGTASARVQVENVPPQLTNVSLPAHFAANASFPYSIDARDPDGPAPPVVWSFDGVTRAGAAGSWSLAAGTHHILVEATDHDGATTTLQFWVVVPESGTGGLVEQAPQGAGSSGPTRDSSSAEGNGTASPDASNAPVGSGWTLPTAPTIDLEIARPNVSIGAPAELAVVGVPLGDLVRMDFGDANGTSWTTGRLFSHPYDRAGQFAAVATVELADGAAVEASQVVNVGPVVTPTPTSPPAEAPGPTSRSMHAAAPTPGPSAG
ncbi:MAG: PKD domain-containing protein, partial [Thermoplasmatota archaeon]